MSATRREFLKSAIAGGTALSLGAAVPALARGQAPAAAGKEGLKLLILGGTSFLGPHTVRAALAHGHTITLFNRGKTNPEFFPELEKLRGDRKNDLKALEGRSWDAVLDTSGYAPRHVKMSAELLAPNIKHYVFISTISVYGENRTDGMDESAPITTIDDPDTEVVDGRTYGALKALCEQAAEKAMPGRVTNIRPGLIVGPEDPSDRFTYWPARIDRGGEVLAPGTGDDFVQVIDVRDLADYILACIEKRITGVFNTDGPPASLSMKGLLEACRASAKSDAKLTWVPVAFLDEHKVEGWSDMPVWVPPVGPYVGAGRLSSAKALAKGMKNRPIAETIQATLEWFRGLPEDRRKALRAGIKAEREKEVLAAWHAKQGQG